MAGIRGNVAGILGVGANIVYWPHGLRGASRPVLVPTKGGGWEVREMPTYAAVAMAGNNPSLPGWALRAWACALRVSRRLAS